MTTPTKGKADFLDLGDWNAMCWECGRKFKASTLKRHWQGYWVCPDHWEARQPQDFAKGVPDIQVPPWTQPMPADVFEGGYCTYTGISGIVGAAAAGCAIVGYTTPGIWDFIMNNPGS